MGFINQFPYSDFHEMNLDWLIKQTKANNDKIAYLEEEFSKIVIVTEDHIQEMINASIAANNITVYQAINQVKNDLIAAINDLNTDLTSRYKAYTDAQIALQKIYIDNQDVFYFNEAKTYSDNNLVKAKDYTDSQVLDYTMMINPITGVYEDVRKVVDDIVTYFHTENTLTAGEYDALDLTADDYDNYELTAYDYDFNGKTLLNP